MEPVIVPFAVMIEAAGVAECVLSAGQFCQCSHDPVVFVLGTHESVGGAWLICLAQARASDSIGKAHTKKCSEGEARCGSAYGIYEAA